MARTTPIYQQHVALGAQMVVFAGWEMPVQYTGILEEHLAVRHGAGMFDVSHYGAIFVAGTDALSYLQKLLTNDMRPLLDKQTVYAPMCTSSGGVIEDCTVYPWQGGFLCVLNPLNQDKAFNHMQVLAEGDVTLTDKSTLLAQISLQGPTAKEVLRKLKTHTSLLYMKPNRCGDYLLAGIPTLAATTGFTGERGYDLIVPALYAASMWSALRQAGAVPCGLGARDTLRLEAGLPLYGHELSESITPVEAGLQPYIRLDKEDFVGKQALVDLWDTSKRILVGIRAAEQTLFRNGDIVCNDGEACGVVTSGCLSPSTGGGIAMALVTRDAALDNLTVVSKEKHRPAVRCDLPFYTNFK